MSIQDRIDPDDATALGERGATLLYYHWKLPEAKALLEEALRRKSQGSAFARSTYAWLLDHNLGLPDSAAAVLAASLAENPRDLTVMGAAIWLPRYFPRISADSGVAFCARYESLAGRQAEGQWCNASRLLGRGDTIAARAVASRIDIVDLSGRDAARLALLQADLRDTISARASLAHALREAETSYVREDFVAQTFLALGDRENAIRWLQKARASRSAGIAFLGRARFAPLRGDPRFEALRRPYDGT